MHLPAMRLEGGGAGVQVLDGNGRFLGRTRTFSASSCPDEFVMGMNFVMDQETSDVNGRLLGHYRSFDEEFPNSRTYCLISNQAPLDNDENSDILTDEAKKDLTHYSRTNVPYVHASAQVVSPLFWLWAANVFFLTMV